MATFIQPSFAGGELAPALYGRVDIAKYHVGVRSGRNMFTHFHGGASNRAGLEYIGPCGQHDAAPRFTGFQFKTTDTYILEFGNLYMRVIRDGGYVLEDSVAITGATPDMKTSSPLA